MPTWPPKAPHTYVDGMLVPPAPPEGTAEVPTDRNTKLERNTFLTAADQGKQETGSGSPTGGQSTSTQDQGLAAAVQALTHHVELRYGPGEGNRTLHVDGVKVPAVQRVTIDAASSSDGLAKVTVELSAHRVTVEAETGGITLTGQGIDALRALGWRAPERPETTGARAELPVQVGGRCTAEVQVTDSREAVEQPEGGWVATSRARRCTLPRGHEADHHNHPSGLTWRRGTGIPARDAEPEPSWPEGTVPPDVGRCTDLVTTTEGKVLRCEGWRGHAGALHTHGPTTWSDGAAHIHVDRHGVTEVELAGTHRSGGATYETAGPVGPLGARLSQGDIRSAGLTPDTAPPPEYGSKQAPGVEPCPLRDCTMPVAHMGQHRRKDGTWYATASEQVEL